MAKNNEKALSKFTSEELLAEVSRRQNKNKGWGFVVIDDSDAEEGDCPRFGIVEIAEYEKDGGLADYSLGDRVSLPDCFVEAQEGQYDLLGGDVKKGKDLLTKSGFKYLGIVDI